MERIEIYVDYAKPDGDRTCYSLRKGNKFIGIWYDKKPSKLQIYWALLLNRVGLI